MKRYEQGSKIFQLHKLLDAIVEESGGGGSGSDDFEDVDQLGCDYEERGNVFHVDVDRMLGVEFGTAPLED